MAVAAVIIMLILFILMVSSGLAVAGAVIFALAVGGAIAGLK
jgi:hypothetical protein